jgi:hypothetical protein
MDDEIAIDGHNNTNNSEDNTPELASGDGYAVNFVIQQENKQRSGVG